ncbi:MAG TPA: MFS transporter [Thermoleophilaceae bacterium]|nr:MFS transporter [Thermoleophilaceae bacterium]
MPDPFEAGDDPAARRARRTTLAVASAATALLLLDVTVVYVALPAIENDLGASFTELQWVIDAYALTLAAALLTAGSLADRVGRRVVFSAGLALFTAASLACALSPSAVALDISRGLQGLGAAGMFASSLALLANEFRGADRGFALGVWGAVSGAALAVGPLAGGALVDGLGWEWIFLLNLPAGAALWLLARAGVPESREQRPRPSDWLGLAAFAAAAFLLVVGLTRGNPDGWGSLPVVAAFAGSALALGAFLVRQTRAEDPMLDLSLFRIPAFTGTAIVAFAQSLAIYPMFLFLALWFEDVLLLSPFETGLRLLPVTVTLFLVAPFAGHLTGRVPLRVLLSLGLLLVGASLLLMHGVRAGDEWTALLPGLLVGGVAIGVISPALAAAMVGVLSVERSGLASGVNNTFRQLGIAAGVALLGAVFEHRAGRVPDAAAFADGLNGVFVVAAVVALAAAPLALILVRTRDLAGS